MRWLAVGEAPSKSFFLQLKAKQARDNIRALKDKAGVPVTEDAGMLAITHGFYSKLYQAPIEDGLIAKVLQACWPFVKDLCCTAVRFF